MSSVAMKMELLLTAQCICQSKQKDMDIQPAFLLQGCLGVCIEQAS